MKKLALILLIIFCLFTFSACFGNTILPESFDAEKPWGVLDTAYEKSVYTVEKRERIKKGDEYIDGDTLTQNGVLEQVLTCQNVNGVNYTTVTTSFSISYKDIDANGNDRGKTDNITSTVVFATSGCTPVESTKTVTLAPRKSSDNSYVTNNSYSYSVDYANAKAVIKFGKGIDSNGELSQVYDSETTITLKPNQSFDNEQLFYILRAFKNTKSEGSYTFKLMNAFDSYIFNDSYPYTMTTEISADLTAVELGDFIKEYSSDEVNIPCLKVSVYKQDSKSGPPIVVYISNPDLKFKREESEIITSKLVTKIVTKEYDLDSSSPTYNTEKYNYVYTLSDYSTKKPTV